MVKSLLLVSMLMSIAWASDDACGNYDSHSVSGGGFDIPDPRDAVNAFSGYNPGVVLNSWGPGANGTGPIVFVSDDACGNYSDSHGAGGGSGGFNAGWVNDGGLRGPTDPPGLNGPENPMDKYTRLISAPGANGPDH